MSTFRIAEMAKEYLEYDMIQTYTELPDFPEYRTRLLFAFLNEGLLTAKSSELFALVTSLVQMGLDTHDLVSELNDEKEKAAARSRQLKVLAGDYFSSRFYNLLSQAEQIDIVGQLSSAICEVNRLKMNLYILMKQLKMTAEEYIQQSVGIKMQLFLSFTRLMEGARNLLWPEVLQVFTRCEVLLQELARTESPQSIRGSWAFWHILPFASKDEKKQLQSDTPDPGKLRAILLKYNVFALLNQMLESQLEQLRKKIAQLDSDKLGKELEQIGAIFARYAPRTRVLEEM